MRGRLGKTLLISALTGASLMASTAGAQAATADAAPMRIDIPAQGLGDALRALALATRLQIVFDEAQVSGRRAPALRGAYTARGALDTLIAATGLVARPGPSGSVLVEPTQARSDALTAQAVAAEDAPSSADIVVTAQKREQRIQDVPIAISAFTQQTLDKQKIEGGPDLLKAVPNVTFSKSNFAGYNLSIRGIGTKALSVTTDPGVAVNFNSTTLLTNRFFEQEFFDLERIEVLRGPQGTLYGRNATGGVVNIISNKPDLTKFGGYLKAEGGNYGSRRAQGAINVPIVDDILGLRLAGAYTKRTGFTSNDITGNRIDGRKLYTTRLTASVAPTSTLRYDLVWERFHENDNRARTAKQLCHRDNGPATIGNLKPLQEDTRGFLSQGCKPGSLYDDDAYGVPNGLSLPYVQLGQDSYFGQLGYDPTRGSVTVLTPYVDPYAGTTQTHDLRRISSITDPIYRATANVYELNVSWDVADRLQLVSQTAFNKDGYYSTQDYNRFNTVPIFNSSDGLTTESNGTVPSIPIAPRGIFNDPQLGPSNRLVAQDLVTANSKQFSQELRLATIGAGRFQGTAGANYTWYKNQVDYFVFINTLTAVIQGPNGFIGNNSVDPNFCNRFPLTEPARTNTPASNDAGCTYVDPNPLASINGQGHNYFRSSNRFTLKSFGIFADGSYDLFSDFKVLGGLRYNDDRKVTTPVPSQLLLSTNPILAGTVNYGYPEDPKIRQHFTAVTGRLGVQWSPQTSFTDDTMVYFTFSRGYKAGGTNPPPIGFSKEPVAPGSPPFVQLLSYPATFRPEYINAFELGTKNTLLNDTLTANLTAYYYDYKNYQVSQIQDRQAINENYKASVYGAEAELLWRPNQALAVNANFGLQKTRLGKNQYSIDVMDRLQGHEDEYVLLKPFVQLPSNCVVKRSVVEQIIATNQANGSPGNDYPESGGLFFVCPGSALSDRGIPADSFPNGGRGFYADVGHNELPNAPHFTMNLGAEYNIPVFGDWVLTPRADFYHQASSWARVYNTSIDRLRGWENVNFSLRFGNPKSQILAEFYIKNVFDSTPITDAFINSDDTGLTTNVFTYDPRLIGLNVTKRF